MQEEISKYTDKCIIGVDFGEAQTGLAVGKNGAVSAIRAVPSKDRMFAVQQVSKVVKENKAQFIVIGLPLSFGDRETKESLEVRRFARLLRTRLGTPIVFVNEYGSSNEAIEEAIDSALPRKLRRSVDSISATIILKRFFSDEGFD
jgi:putative holliday junction resolvase